MKIIVWGINYSPELTGIGVYNSDLCKFLSASGHDVTMVTAFPYYPAWRKRAADAFCLSRFQIEAGVKLWRCWQYVPSNPTVLRRILHEASFALTSTFRLLNLPSSDVLVVVGPPLLLGVAASLITLIKRIPLVYHLQDLQPTAALSLGMLKPGLFTKLLFALQRFSYEHARQISSISPRMCQVISSQGALEEKIRCFPNWVALPDLANLPRKGTWKNKHEIASSMSIVSYAGNLGIKQGLELVIEAADSINDKEQVLFVIAGNGGNENLLKRTCRDRGIKNVLFHDVLNEEDHTALILDSDICLIPQKTGSSIAFLPSKLLKILALGRPVITNADEHSALDDAVREGNFGVSVKPGDAGELARAISELLQDERRRESLGAAGRLYVEQFDREEVLSEFQAELRNISIEPHCNRRSQSLSSRLMAWLR